MTIEGMVEARAAAMRMVQETPWMILPSSLRELVTRIESAPLDVSEETLALFTREQAARNAARRTGAVAVIPIAGRITHKAASGFMSFLFGGTSTEGVSAALRQALAEPGVGTIMLDIDSPGGSVYGVDELAREIFNARQQKRVVAMVNPLAASAAYYLASQADEIVVTPTGEVGSIGVFAMHADFSAMDERMGVKFTLISAGKYKTEGNDMEPLSDEARAYMQSQVDTYYRMFVGAVARGRGVPVATVESDFGQGRTLLSAAAKKAGMVDRVATYNETVGRLTGASPATDSSQQTAEGSTVTITFVASDTNSAAEIGAAVAAQIRSEYSRTHGDLPAVCEETFGEAGLSCTREPGHEGEHAQEIAMGGEMPSGEQVGAALEIARRRHALQA